MTLSARLAAGDTIFTAWSSLPEPLTTRSFEPATKLAPRCMKRPTPSEPLMVT